MQNSGTIGFGLRHVSIAPVAKRLVNELLEPIAWLVRQQLIDADED
jgi:hypothetical protein